MTLGQSFLYSLSLASILPRFPVVLLLFRICRLDERDVVAFEHNSPDLLPRPLLEVHLGRVVHDQVHELVEANDVALDTRIDILVKPAKYAFPVLQETED